MSDGNYPSERLSRAAAPPYRGEREHAMWHFSEDPGIRRFEPRPSELAGGEALVWAIDSRHAPMLPRRT